MIGPGAAVVLGCLMCLPLWQTTEVGYDPAGRVQAERYFDEVDTLLETIAYTYDLDGNRTSRTSGAGLEVYEYDPGSQLKRVTLDGVETQRFEYDENGRVSRIVRDGLDQRLHWDALDRLVRVEDLNFIEDPVDFAYDGQGRRVSADRADSAQRYVVGPTGNQSLESPHLVHNGFFLTGELVYGGEHALWRYDGSEPPDTRVYLRDAMGSVIGLMDPQGNLVETFDYDAFGNVRSAGGEALPEVSFGGDSRFQGMWKDSGTGLYYVRARYYDAQTGRFLSRDPVEGQLEQPESFMPYVFANGNPYVSRDPRGEFTLSELSISPVVSAAIIGAVSGAGFDVAFQLAFNGGNLRCVSLESAAISAGLGLLAGPLGSAHLTGVRRAYLATTQALARITNRVGRIAGRSAAKTVFDFLSGPVGAPLLLRNILTQGKILRDIVAAALRGRQALDKTLTRLAASAGSSNAGATAAASRAGAAQGGALVGLYDLPIRTCGR